MYKELTKNSRKIDCYFEKKKQRKELFGQSQSSSDELSSSQGSDDDIELDMERMMEGEEDEDKNSNVQKSLSSSSSSAGENLHDDAEKKEDKHEVQKTNVQNESAVSKASSANMQKTGDHDITDGKALPANDSVKAVSRTDNMQKNPDITAAALPAIKSEGASSTNITAGKLLKAAKSRLKGTWHFATKRQKIDQKARTCKICGQVKETLKKLEKHIKQKHKKFKYKCRFCHKLYETKNSLYKHKLYHTVGLRYICKKCDKAFMFYSQYREHSSVHTDSKKNKFPCRKKNCDKYYGSTQARNYHEQVHCTLKDDKGSKCGTVCSTRQSMDIHIRGIHGEGWNALCGEHYYWPTGKTRHKQKCTVCKKLRKSMQRNATMQTERFKCVFSEHYYSKAKVGMLYVESITIGLQEKQDTNRNALYVKN